MSIPAYSAIVNPQLLGDLTKNANSGSADTLPTPTQSGGVNVSAFLEIQSPTNGLGFLNARLTQAQINAMTVVNGMQAYNSTTNTLQAYVNGAWANLLNSDANLSFPAVLPAATATFNISAGGVVTYDIQPDLHVSGTLMTADMAALNTTSVQVLGAAPVNFQYMVTRVLWNLVSTGHTAFATGGNVYVQYGTGVANTNFATARIANTFFQNATNFNVNAGGVFNDTTGLASTVTAAAPLAIAASANFTAGAGSSVNYTVYYKIVPVV